MTAAGFALFDTAIGACALAWTSRGIAGVQLPEGSAGQTRGRMQRRFPAAMESAPPAHAQSAIDAIVALLGGEPRDLSEIPLDLDGVPEFHQRVYDVARRIPSGGTMSYGEIATALGLPGAARAVGQALGRNPVAVIVPCHRVLAAGGRMGGFSATGGVATKRRMLAIERGIPSLFP
jgi:methylated-DNA-[protein]-cysteine S-methyltransferase